MKYYLDDTNIKLIESPMTKFINCITQELLNAKKNVIIEFPTRFNNWPLIIANQYVYQNLKTTIIFTDPDSIEKLNDEYYLLLEDSIPFRLRVPIGIKTESGIKIKVNFPKQTKKSLKNKYIVDYQKALLDKKAIIILASDTENLNQFDGDILHEEYKQPYLIVFDDVFLSSENKILKLIEWCDHNQLQYLILVNHLSTNFYKNIPSDTLIIPFHNGLLKELSTMDENIYNKFMTDEYKNHATILSKYSIDQPSHYLKESNLHFVEINNGNSLIQCAKDMSQILSSTKITSILLKHELIQLINIAYDSINSFVPIEKLTKYSEVVGARINGFNFCSIILELSEEYGEDVKSSCRSLTSIFYTIWRTLHDCKSPFFDKGYTKDNKFTILIDEILNNIPKYQKIFILPTNKQELNIINKLLKITIPQYLPKLTITSIANLNNNELEANMAILSGCPKMNELYALNLPFDKIEILTYHGDDTKFTKDIISLYTYIDEYRSNFFSNSIQNILKTTPNMINYLSIIPSLENYIKKTNQTPIAKNDVVECINTDVVKKYPSLNDYLKELDKYAIIKKQYEDESNMNQISSIKQSSSYYIITLENIYSGDIMVTYSSLKTIHPFFINGELIESTLSEDMEGSIMVKTPGNHNNLLDMLLDLYNVKDKIDYEIVEIWEECIKSFENSNLTTNSLYENYCKLGGTKQKQTVHLWFTRKLMGPNNKTDLEYIGKALGNEDLMTNANYIFNELEQIRNYKRALGRKLNRIVASIIQHENTTYDDPFTEIVSENVRNYLYTIKCLEKINNEK